MSLQLRHSKVSSIPDGPDSSLVRSSDWNADHTLSGAKADFNSACTDDDFAFIGTAQSWAEQQTFKETKETSYNLTGTVIDPANGTIQYKTLSANTTLTEALEDGQSLILMIDDGTAYTITWPTITWINGSAPTLKTTGYTTVVLWKVGTTLYGEW